MSSTMRGSVFGWRIMGPILVCGVGACAMPKQATRAEPESAGNEDTAALPPDAPKPMTAETRAPEVPPAAPRDTDARSACDRLPEGQCLDFESASIPSSWTMGKMGFLRVDDIHAHSGKRALHVTLPKGDGPQYGYTMSTAKAVPKNDGIVFGRMYFFAAAPVGGHVMLIQAAGADGSQYQFNVLGKTYITLIYKDAHLGMTSCGSCADKENATTVIGKWTCLETEFDGKTGNPSKVYVDGVLLRLKPNGKAIPVVGSFRRLNFGYDLHVGKHDDIDVWIDDVAVSTSRIGCD